jgi:hypothetical protein
MDTARWKQLIEVHEAMSDDNFNLDERPNPYIGDNKSVDAIVDKPSHYAQYAIEPKNFIIRNGMEFWRGNIIKYASRAGSKMYAGMDEYESEVIDLKKVIRYAEMRINQINGEYDL